MTHPGAKALFGKFFEMDKPPDRRGPAQAHRRGPPHRIGQISGAPDTLSRKRGITLRINETYEHDSILSCSSQGEESCPIGSGCNKISAQCVDVSAPMTLMPTASIGTVNISCQGSPTVTCVTDPAGTSCAGTMTQQICVTVPVRYGVTMTAGEPTIACADSCTGCGCC